MLKTCGGGGLASVTRHLTRSYEANSLMAHQSEHLCTSSYKLEEIDKPTKTMDERKTIKALSCLLAQKVLCQEYHVLGDVKGTQRNLEFWDITTKTEFARIRTEFSVFHEIIERVAFREVGGVASVLLAGYSVEPERID